MRKRKLSRNRVVSDVNISIIKKKRNYSAWIVGIVIFIMIFSSVAFVFFNSPSSSGEETLDNFETINYNGFELKGKENLGWILNLNEVDYGFEYNPITVENIDSSIEDYDVYFGKRLYLLFDPVEFSDSSAELQKLSSFLGSRGVFVSLACSKSEGCINLPVVGCMNDDSVYLKRGVSTKIYNNDRCIVLEAKAGEELIVINRFIYGVLGVING